MILIADSGSTKCVWAECSSVGKIVKIHQTVGFNPKYTTDKSLLIDLKNSSLVSIRNEVSEIHFYGAGCSSRKRNEALENSMRHFFLNAKITVKHDLEAAIKASYKGTPIICSILGTGSNSCFYDGKNIIENAPSLGFIVGDEASGNYFGKKILSLYFNNIMSDELKEKLVGVLIIYSFLNIFTLADDQAKLNCISEADISQSDFTPYEILLFETELYLIKFLTILSSRE